MLLKILLLLCLLFPLLISNADIINQNQPITDTDVIISKKGYFALGFFSPGKSNHRYLGIWYHKLPEITVVWVANRDNPINGFSGFLSLSPDGNLVLYNNHSELLPLWSTNVTKAGTEGFVAQLQDSGNLVITRKERKRIVWQSFDYPTDTMLPRLKLGLDLKLGLNRALTSWRTQDDPGTGDWLFQLDPTGCPQFILYHKGFSLTPYWRTASWPWDTPKVHDGVASYAYNQDEIYYAFIPNDESIFKRIVVTSSGFVQQITWDNSSLQWRESPPEPKYKYGNCGPYGLLNRNSVDSLECMCLPGYKPKSLENWYLRDGSAGCTREKSQQTMCRNGEGFVKVDSVKIPDTSIAALLDRNFSISQCRHLCLSNCSCTAFAMLNIDGKGLGCVTWYGELMDSMLLSAGRDLYVRADAVTLAEFESKKSYFFRKKGMLAILVSSAALTMFLIILSTYLWVRKKRKEKGQSKAKRKGLISALMENEMEGSMQPADLPIFDLQSISAATNNFNPANKLGQGGFGTVYKGKLEDGKEIAIKRLSETSGQGIAEFKNELVLIARLQHRNLVRLLGCCIEEQEQMLIYEYMPNKSLDYFIFDHTRRPMLDWTKRFDIITGIARGVMYLHHDSRLRIIHRDLKTSNVLLDVDMNPKISDFGMARIFKENEVQDKTNRVAGTFGYMAPEYVIFGKYTTKSDVFSFGVIMLEIISGKKSNTCEADDQASNLIGHVWDLWKEGRVSDIVDSSLRASCVPPDILRCIHIGLLCLEEDVTERPTMPTVVLMLNGETPLPSPKQPAFILTRNQDSTNPFAAGGASSVNEITVTEVEAR